MKNSQKLMGLFLGACIFSLQWTLTHQQVDLALGGIAVQSSTNGPYVAQHAIDGNRASNIGSCTHTYTENNPWWRVDLLAVYGIGTVIITNRGDCCAERINGAEIHIGNSLVNNGNDNPRCAIIPSIPAGASANYTCNKIGRYVNIIIPKPSSILTLCEVEVYEAHKIKVFLRLKLNSSEDLLNPATRDKVLQKMNSSIVEPSVFNLRWTKEPEHATET